MEKKQLHRINLVWCQAAPCNMSYVLCLFCEDQCRESVSAPTSWENTLPVTLLTTMWELFVKTLYRTGQWYFPETKRKKKESRRATESVSSTGWRLIYYQKVPHQMCSRLDYIISPTSSSSTWFNLLLFPSQKPCNTI